VKTAISKVTVRNLQRKIRIDVHDLENFARRAAKLCLPLRHENESALELLQEISVLIVSDRKIAGLHRQFMNEPGPTDVITFQHGEIFISAEMARRNAQRFKNPLTRELHLYIVHGLLHLCGFDDQTPAGARNMERIQQKIATKAEL